MLAQRYRNLVGIAVTQVTSRGGNLAERFGSAIGWVRSFNRLNTTSTSEHGADVARLIGLLPSLARCGLGGCVLISNAGPTEPSLTAVENEMAAMRAVAQHSRHPVPFRKHLLDRDIDSNQTPLTTFTGLEHYAAPAGRTSSARPHSAERFCRIGCVSSCSSTISGLCLV